LTKLNEEESEDWTNQRTKAGCVDQEHEICDVSVWWFDIQSKRFSVFILDQKEKESSGIDKEVVESMRRLVKRSRCLYSHAALGKPKYSSKENTGKKNLWN